MIVSIKDVGIRSSNPDAAMSVPIGWLGIDWNAHTVGSVLAFVASATGFEKDIVGKGFLHSMWEGGGGHQKTEGNISSGRFLLEV